jgi:hypothetical protein
LTNYHQALDVLTRWSHYYNYERPHSSLKYLRTADYYRGDPAARLADRERKLGQAAETRQVYWLSHSTVKEQGDPRIIRDPFCLTYSQEMFPVADGEIVKS